MVSMSIKAASRTGAPSIISATAAVAARVAPQPSASKVTESIRPSSTRNEIRDRSPQAAPPAAPVKASSATGPCRLSSRKKCSKSSRSIGVKSRAPGADHHLSDFEHSRACPKSDAAQVNADRLKKGSNPPLPPLALIPSIEGGCLLRIPRDSETSAPAPFVLGQTVRRLSYGFEPAPHRTTELGNPSD